MADFHKFSDFAVGETKLDGEKVKLKDIFLSLHRTLNVLVFTTLLRML